MTAAQVPNVWLVVAGVSLVTFALRASFLLGIDRLGGLPPTLERITPFVPPVVLAALVAPNLFLSGGSVTIGPAASANNGRRPPSAYRYATPRPNE